MTSIVFDIKHFQPLEGVPVGIRTNWSRYTARLSRSVFGGYEFRSVGSDQAIQLTVVRQWSFCT